jgi:hypothetical protein
MYYAGGCCCCCCWWWWWLLLLFGLLPLYYWCLCQLLVYPCIVLSLQDRAGNLAIHHALENWRVDLLPTLISHLPADSVNHNNKQLHTPVRLAVMVALKEPATRSAELEAVLALLAEKNADFNLPDDSGTVPLHLAAAAGNDIAVRTLIRHNANVHITKKDGMVPALLRLCFVSYVVRLIIVVVRIVVRMVT